jgi:hypothetical protein
MVLLSPDLHFFMVCEVRLGRRLLRNRLSGRVRCLSALGRCLSPAWPVAAEANEANPAQPADSYAVWAGAQVPLVNRGQAGFLSTGPDKLHTPYIHRSNTSTDCSALFMLPYPSNKTVSPEYQRSFKELQNPRQRS